MATIFPKTTLVAMFKAFEYHRLMEEPGRAPAWVLDPDRSQPLDAVINGWLKESRAEIQQISAPSVSMYNENAESRVLVISVTLLYVPPTEGTTDECGATNHGVDRVVRPVQSGGKKSADLYEPPKTSRSTGVEPPTGSG